MKKSISKMLIAAALVSSMSLSAAAADITPEGNNSHDVKAKYVEGSQTDQYKVELSWGAMQFTYSASTQEWNTEKHDWDTKKEASWSVDTTNGNLITITNHSSKAVTANLSYAPETGNTVSGTFTWKNNTNATTVKVGSAADENAAVTETVTFMPSGTLNQTDNNKTTYEKIGSITVTLE